MRVPLALFLLLAAQLSAALAAAPDAGSAPATADADAGVSPPVAGPAEATAGPRFDVVGRDEGLPTSLPMEVVVGGGAVWVTVRDEARPPAIVGLARVEGGRAVDAGAGLRSPRVAALAWGANTLWAGTDRGLHRLTGERFEPLGDEAPVAALAVAPDGAVWAAVGDPDARLARVEGSALVPPAGGAACRGVLRIIAVSRDRAALVCASAILLAEGGRARSVDLRRTPLYHQASREEARDPERRTPPVWIHDAAPCGAAIWLAGHTQQLVRWQDGRFEARAAGHFSHFAQGPVCAVADFAGKVTRIDDGGLTPVADLGDGTVGRMATEGDGTVWLVAEPRSGGHALWRLRPPYGAPDALWSLRRGTTLSPAVLGLAPDGAGGAWLTTNRGLWHATGAD